MLADAPGHGRSDARHRSDLLHAGIAHASAGAEDPQQRTLPRRPHAGQVIEDYSYDGFDRTAEHRKLVTGSLTSTRYTYDPLDRTVSRTEKAGSPSAKTTDFAYLGLTASCWTSGSAVR